MQPLIEIIINMPIKIEKCNDHISFVNIETSY